MGGCGAVPCVEHRLTPLERSLEAVLAAMHESAIQHGVEIRRSANETGSVGK